MRTYALEALRRLNPILTRELGDPSRGDERIEKDRFDAEIDDALTDVFG